MSSEYTRRAKWSLWVCLISGLLLFGYRLGYSDAFQKKALKVTTWDAFGYYMYLPSALIYHDATELKWLPEKDSVYQLTGGELYQSNKHTNGNYVNKYLGGVAIIELPFFAAGHIVALAAGYPADGFSPPYQYAIAFGAVIYVFLALLLLRRILLRYYSDKAVALALGLLVLATNLIQYVSVDGAMSHAYIFPLYVLVLYTTLRWHETPHWKWAALTGWIIGLAVISRPTELIMLFIPLWWNTQTKEAARVKWQLVRARYRDVLLAVLCGVIGIAPQLIYWKMTAGSWLYDVGSKWFFFNPFFRVLFGFENGWFIYTPVTILFVLGFFFIRNQPFRRSVIVFCLLNIWIVIAWSDWKYGATYSTRALTQSYPVFMLAFTAVVERIIEGRWKWLFLGVALYLPFVNLFQIWQYNRSILHYRDMNAAYYRAIYLDADPEPLDMSLLDTDEYFRGTPSAPETRLTALHAPMEITNAGEFPDIILSAKAAKGGFVHVKCMLEPNTSFAQSYLNCKLISGENVKEKVFRMANAITADNQLNTYEFYVRIPDDFRETEILLFTTSFGHFTGTVKEAFIGQVSP